MLRAPWSILAQNGPTFAGESGSLHISGAVADGDLNSHLIRQYDYYTSVPAGMGTMAL